MAQNFIYITDLHICEGKKGRRIEPDIFEVIDRKMRVVYDYAEEHDSLGIIVGGDVFDKYNPPISTIASAIELFSRSPKPIYTVIGNHDVPGSNIERVDSSALGILAKTGSIEIFNDLILGPFRIHAMHWSKENKSKLFVGYENPKPDKSKVNVLVSHAQIGPSDTLFSYGFHNLKISGYDIALFGDIHHGFGPAKVSGCLVGNCGSLWRKSIAEKNLKISCFKVNDDKTIDVLPIPYEDDPFEKSVSSGIDEEFGSEFLSALEMFEDEFLDGSPVELIEKVKGSEGIDDRFVEELLREIKEIEIDSEAEKT